MTIAVDNIIIILGPILARRLLLPLLDNVEPPSVFASSHWFQQTDHSIGERCIERLVTRAHDKAWQELVDLKVVRLHETPESVRTDASSRQKQAEEDQAQEAVERARSEAAKVYKITQEDPRRLHIPKAKRISMLGAAANKLNAAKERLQCIKRRNHQIITFVRGTFGYNGAKRDAARQSMLVQWVLQQVPLIEAEITQSKVTKAGPGRMTRSKRRLTTDEEPQGRASPKRPKLDYQESGPPASSSSPRVPSKAKLEPLATTDQEATQGDDVGAVLEDDLAVAHVSPPRAEMLPGRVKSKAPAAQPSDPPAECRERKGFDGDRERTAERRSPRCGQT
ncbi:hypothetical protein ACHAPT_013138 [Fusarium lateritium]